jgi:hypothetical protein
MESTPFIICINCPPAVEFFDRKTVPFFSIGYELPEACKVQFSKVVPGKSSSPFSKGSLNV